MVTHTHTHTAGRSQHTTVQVNSWVRMEALEVSYHWKVKVKCWVHAVAVCRCLIHLLSHWPWSLWWKVICYPGTQEHCDIRDSTVYLPQVSLSTHLSTNPFGRMNSWVSCVLTAFVWDQTQASRYKVRRANHCTTEALNHCCYIDRLRACSLTVTLSTVRDKHVHSTSLLKDTWTGK